MTIWFVIIGILLILMGLLYSLLGRLPLSTGLVYLLIGFVLGPAGADLLRLNLFEHAATLEFVFEIVVLVSLFTVGLKLRVPLNLKLWRLPIRLATVSMVIAIFLVCLAGHIALDLPLGLALLLGAILAPTDPVLASDIQIRDPGDHDGVRFGLTAEGGLNDGAAFPFVTLALGLLGLHELGISGWHWLAMDVFWGIAAGLAIGWICGRAVGTLVVRLRRARKMPLGLEEFLTMGLIALSYGLALTLHALGFLAVLAAGLAMRQIELEAATLKIGDDKAGLDGAGLHDSGLHDSMAASSISKPAHHSVPAEQLSAHMVDHVLGFNERLERIGEVAAVLLLGGLLSAGYWSIEGLFFAAFLFLVVRPISILPAVAGLGLSKRQRWLLSWFGIRGVGSMYYLSYAIHKGLDETDSARLIPLIVCVVAASVFAHGISATPLMNWYARRRPGRQMTGHEDQP